MAGTTPVYAFPYPSLSDPPNGAAQMQSLATAVENKVVTMDSAISTLQNPALVGGTYIANAPQTMPTGLTKINFPTAVTVAAGITWNGSNQFTTTAAGIYALSASLYMPGAAGFSFNVVIGDAAATLGGNFVSGVFTAAGLAAEASITLPLGAGTNISAYCYNNSGSAASLFSFDPAMFFVWRVA